MRVCTRTAVALLVVLLGSIINTADVAACGNFCDPCLLVYPTSRTVYHYNPCRYYVVTAGHPLYDPAYDIGGEVLIMNRLLLPDRIAYEVYQAPNLTGFRVAVGEYTGFYYTGRSFDLVVDGFCKGSHGL